MTSERLLSFTLFLFFLVHVTAICPFNDTSLTPWTWNQPNGQVTIPAGQRVLISQSPPRLDWIRVSGTLVFDNADINLDVNWIRVEKDGEILMGSEEDGCQITKKIIVTFWGDRVDSTVNTMGSDPADNIAFGVKGLGLCTGGTLELHGYVSGPSWTRLAQTATSGSSSISLQEPVNWQAGDSIVIATTDFPQIFDYKLPDYNKYPSIRYQYGKASPDQTESRKIVSVSSDGLVVQLDMPLNYTHWGDGYEKAEVGLLSRHIVLQGDPSSNSTQFGGHLMMRKGKAIHIRGVEVTRMGQLGILGRYPIHWHLLQDVIGAGFYVRDSSIHHVYQRCVVLHASHGLLVQDNVAYETNGHCYFLEDGVEVMNILDHNLGINAKPIASEDPRQPIPTDTSPTIFWITNPNNTWTNNAAVSGKFAYWFSLPLRPMGVSAALFDKDPLWARGRLTPLRLFSNNVAHSCYDNCLQIDQNVRQDGTIEQGTYSPSQGPYNRTADSGYPRVDPEFSGFLAYKSRAFGVWGKSSMKFSDVVLLNNRRGFMVNGVSLLENSLIIGESDNIGYPRPGHSRSFPDNWGSNTTMITGHETYDNGGPQFMRNVTFRNFISTETRKAAAIGVLQNGPFMLDTENVYRDLKFENANVVYLNQQNGDAPYGWTVLDSDSSATGVQGGAWLVNPSAPHMLPDDVSCTLKPEWNTYVCPPHPNGYVQVVFRNNNGYMPSGDGFGDANPDRLPESSKKVLGQWFSLGSNKDEGGPVTGAEVTCTSANSGKCWQFMANTVPGRAITVRFYNDVSYVKTPQNFTINMESSKPGDWIVIAFPLPKNALPLKVTNDKGELSRVYSACDLNANSYLYSGADEHLYLKFVNGRVTKDFSGKWNFTDYNSDAPRITVESNGPGCDIDGCAVSNYEIPPVKQALAFPTDLFEATMLPCKGTKGYGTAFFKLIPLERKLKFGIYHDLSAIATKLVLYNGDPQNGGTPILSKDFMAVATPVHGVFSLSRIQWSALTNSKLYLSLNTNQTQNHLCGQIKCEDTDGCTDAPVVAQPDPCKPVGETMDVYIDAPVTPWSDQSYSYWPADEMNTTVVYNDTNPLCGTNNIKLTIRRGAFAMVIRSSTLRPIIDPSKWKFLEFWISLPANTTETNLKVWLEDGKKRISSDTIGVTADMILNYVINSEDGWTRVRVPLSALNVTGPQVVSKLGLILNDGWNTQPVKTIYLDQIRFTTDAPEPVTSGSNLDTIRLAQANTCSADAAISDYSIQAPGLAPWAIAIIVIVVLLVVAGVIGGVVFYLKRTRVGFERP